MTGRGTVQIVCPRNFAEELFAYFKLPGHIFSICKDSQ